MGEQPVVPLAPRQPFWGLVVFPTGAVVGEREGMDGVVDGGGGGREERGRR